MKRRLLSCLLVMSVLISGISLCASYAASTEEYLAHGDLDSTYFSWKLDYNGVLTISGSSFLSYRDYTQNPWYPYRDHIKTLVITGSMSSIAAYAFYEFPELTSVILDCNYLDTIGECAFYGCPKLCSVDFGVGVSTIGPWAFANCSSLRSVFLPRRTYSCSVNEFAFYGCTALKKASFSGWTELGEHAFSQCETLSRVYLIDNTDAFYLKAADNSFSDVTAQVHYPLGSLKYHPEFQSYGGALTWLESCEGTCGTDAEWTYDETAKTLRIFGSGKVSDPYFGGNDMPWGAFNDEILTILVEDGITDIPSYTFEYCTNVTGITLPRTLIRMDLNAFNDCEQLNDLLLPSSLEQIGDDYNATYSFIRCSSLTDVYYLGTEEEWKQVGNAALVDNTDSTMTLHYLIPQSKAPTCTEPGIETYYTFDDSSVYSGMYDLSKNLIAAPDPISPTGHSYGDWSVTLMPTCDQEGTVTRTCATCQARETGRIPAPGHQFSRGICCQCGQTDPTYSSVTVLVTSYGEPTVPVTLSLYLPKEDTPSYTAQGANSKIVLEGVLQGEYRMMLQKEGHGVLERSITVTPGVHEYSVCLYPLGDVLSDGRLNVGDVSKLYSHIRKVSPLLDEYTKTCADINCDGKINVADTSLLYSIIRRIR